MRKLFLVLLTLPAISFANVSEDQLVEQLRERFTLEEIRDLIEMKIDPIQLYENDILDYESAKLVQEFQLAKAKQKKKAAVKCPYGRRFENSLKSFSVKALVCKKVRY